MIAIASDHAGVSYKCEIIRYFEQENIKFIDFGTRNFSVNDSGLIVAESVNYPEFAKKVCLSILKNECDKGILICGTGIGMSIAANRFRGIFAALCKDEFTARRARSHNNANVLCIGESVTPKADLLKIVKTFMNTDFDGGRHAVRLQQIEDLKTEGLD